MIFFTQAQLKQLLINGKAYNRSKDHEPVAKLVLPGTGFVILITQIDSENPDLAFGLCDLGTGNPELGYFDLAEVSELRTSDGYVVEYDPSFEAIHPLSVYVSAARYFNAITTAPEELDAQGSFFFSGHDTA